MLRLIAIDFSGEVSHGNSGVVLPEWFEDSKAVQAKFHRRIRLAWLC